jgi:DNA-binding LytR/AlgR family response regulator
VNIRTANQEYIVLDTLKSLELQLSELSFTRIHKSFIINMNKIKSIGMKKLILFSEQEIPIGDSYRANLLNRIK